MVLLNITYHTMLTIEVYNVNLGRPVLLHWCMHLLRYTCTAQHDSGVRYEQSALSCASKDQELQVYHDARLAQLERMDIPPADVALGPVLRCTDVETSTEEELFMYKMYVDSFRHALRLRLQRKQYEDPEVLTGVQAHYQLYSNELDRLNNAALQLNF